MFTTYPKATDAARLRANKDVNISFAFFLYHTHGGEDESEGQTLFMMTLLVLCSDLLGSLSLPTSSMYNMPAECMTYRASRYLDHGSSRDRIPLVERNGRYRLIGDMCQASHVPRFSGTRAAGTLHETASEPGLPRWYRERFCDPMHNLIS